ncbi:MAG TPA: hypothetical protein VN622_15140 [Clostridia bacterium]|nr:hypothetical protein [Clostridia bacterium]
MKERRSLNSARATRILNLLAIESQLFGDDAGVIGDTPKMIMRSGVTCEEVAQKLNESAIHLVHLAKQASRRIGKHDQQAAPNGDPRPGVYRKRHSAVAAHQRIANEDATDNDENAGAGRQRRMAASHEIGREQRWQYI